MTNPKDKMTYFLRDDEKVLWEGHPAGVSLLEAPYTIKVIAQWVFGALFAVFGVWYLSAFYFGAQSPQTDYLVIGCSAILIGVCLFWSPFATISRLKSKTRYYITNQRFVACCGTGSTMSFTYRELSDMAEMTIESIGKNRYNIYIGSMNKSLRNHARDQIQNYIDNHKMLPLTFHSVENAFNCTDVLPDYITVKQSAQPVSATT